MQRTATAKENAFVTAEHAPVIKALKGSRSLQQAFAEYCIARGADVLTIGLRIKHIVDGRPVRGVFMSTALLRFGDRHGTTRKATH